MAYGTSLPGVHVFGAKSVGGPINPSFNIWQAMLKSDGVSKAILNMSVVRRPLAGGGEVSNQEWRVDLIPAQCQWVPYCHYEEPDVCLAERKVPCTNCISILFTVVFVDACFLSL